MPAFTMQNLPLSPQAGFFQIQLVLDVAHEFVIDLVVTTEPDEFAPFGFQTV